MMEPTMEDRRLFDTTLAEGLKELIQIAKQGSKDLAEHMAREEGDISNIQKEIVKQVATLERRLDSMEACAKAEVSRYHDGHDPNDVKLNDEWTTRKRKLEEKQETATVAAHAGIKWDLGKAVMMFLAGLVVFGLYGKIETYVVAPAITRHEKEADKRLEAMEKQFSEIKDLLRNAPARTSP